MTDETPRGLLLPYQTAWVQDRSPLKVHRKSRRIGLSWCEAYASAMHCAESGGNVRYISFRKDITRQFIDDCAWFAKLINAAAGEIGEEVIKDEERDIHVYSIDFANGRRIEAMSGAAVGFRSGGQPGDWAIIDEAEFIKDIESVLASALAYLIWGGECHVISSVDIEGSDFDRLCTEVREGTRPGTLHTTTFKDAIAAGLYRRICRRNTWIWTEEGEEAWEAQIRAIYRDRAAQELDCITRSGDEHWLTWQMIHDAEHDDAGKPELTGTGLHWGGVDIAIRRNLWCASDLEEVGDVLWVRRMETLRPAPLRTQVAVLHEMFDPLRVVRIAADQTGMGEFAIEVYDEEFGSLIEGVILSTGQRLSVATALRQRFEDRTIRIPKSEPLRTDLRSIRTAQGATGAPRLVGDTTSERSHGDRFWSLALAAAAAADGGGPIEGLIAGDRPAAPAFAEPARPGDEPRQAIDYELGVVRGVTADFGGMV